MPAPPQKKASSGTWKIAVVIIAIIGIAALAEVISFYYPDTSSPTNYLATVYIPNGSANNRSLTFNPETVTLVLGINNTVQWFNLDQTSNAVHSVVFTQVPTNANVTAASLSACPASSGIRYEVYCGPILLPASGTYQYYDSFHPWMTGAIIVKP
jgi:plastocyanin